MLLTEQVVIEGAISCIRYRISLVYTVLLIELFHQGDKTVHIGTVLHDICYGNVLVRHSDLNVVCRKELVISHIVLFHPHKGCIMIGFRIAVSVRSAYLNLFHVF